MYLPVPVLVTAALVAATVLSAVTRATLSHWSLASATSVSALPAARCRAPSTWKVTVGVDPTASTSNSTATTLASARPFATNVPVPVDPLGARSCVWYDMAATRLLSVVDDQRAVDQLHGATGGVRHPDDFEQSALGQIPDDGATPLVGVLRLDHQEGQLLVDAGLVRHP